MPDTQRPPRSPQAIWLEGCAIFLCALLALATLDMLAKDVVMRHPAPMVNLVRYGVVLLMAIVLMLRKRLPWRLPSAHRKTVLLRGFMLGTVGLSFMQALRSMPLAEATAIYFLSPLMIVALSPWVLGEKVTRGQVVAVLAGFAGMLLIVRPGSALPVVGSLLMLTAAAAYAMLQLLTRRLAGKVGLDQQYAWTAVVCTGMTLLSLPSAGALYWPGLADLSLMVLVGLLSGIGQYLLIKAFLRVPASSLAPFNYFHLLLALLFSVVVFGQLPDAWALLGMTVIAGAGLVLTLPVFLMHMKATLAARQASN